MKFLASLLEYKQIDLQKKLSIIENNLDQFLKLTNSQSQKICLHIDSVLPKFAARKNISPSLSWLKVYENLRTIFVNKSLNISIHLMGETADLLDLEQDMKRIEIPFGWRLTFFVQEADFFYLNSLVKNLTKDLTGTRQFFQTGIWYDLGCWKKLDFEKVAKLTDNLTDNFLLMTVPAGLSGQKLKPEIKKISLEKAQKYPLYQFILDGGWSLNQNLSLDEMDETLEEKNFEKLEGGLDLEKQNLEIVSYTSFWSKFVS